MKYINARKALHALANQNKAIFLQRFFKTGKGQYAEGDRFLGVMVPDVRRLVRQFSELRLSEIERLLCSSYNEERLLALLILNRQYSKGDAAVKNATYRCYIKNLSKVNNWNLVDASAPYIMGTHLKNQSRAVLYKLVKSKNLWRRRIAVVSTFHFIKHNDFNDTIKLSALLITDNHDLIHKACGWMLREVGKRDVRILEMFLQKYKGLMPRTMLRYAIERLPEVKRKAYLHEVIRSTTFCNCSGL